MRVLRLLFGLLCVLASCTASRTAVPVQEPATTTTATPLPPPPEPSATAQATVRWPPVPANATRAHVARVVDGDTIVIAGIGVGASDSGGRPGRRARLIGVDTPEIYGGVECYGRLASAFTKRELNDRDVLVAFDVDPVDRYGRALVYVWKLDGTFFNGAIAREGYASPMTVPPNVRHASLLTRYAGDARTAKRGLWSAC